MLFMIYNGKSYIVSKESKDTFDLIPIVVSTEEEKFTTHKEKEVKGIQRSLCNFATWETFLGRKQYFASDEEISPVEKATVGKAKVGKDKI